MPKLKKSKKIKLKLIRTKILEQEEKIAPKIGINFAFKIAALLLIAFLSWNGLLAVYQTVAYMSDTESSADNNFTASTLDFVLEVPFDFSISAIEIGGSATKTIDLINLGNNHKYKVRADNFSGGLCDYLNLEANVDGDVPEYTGSLISFDFGPIVFTDPDVWNFVLSLPSDAPESIIGETCQFKFVFWGSQTRNDLPFGMGFSDTEEEDNSIKAKVCYDAETRSKGYWKNHDDVYKSYLPQYLGCNTVSSECIDSYETISNKAKVTQILETDYELSMRNKLRGQLLAMKFNIAHFKIGEYVPPTSIDNLNQIVSQADDLLQQIPAPSDETLEIMKDYLDGLNQDLRFRTCSSSLVKVTIPNGGEVWWVGRAYDLTWTTKNLACPDDSFVSIWYSRDSGATWGNITTSTENDGVHNWIIPLFLEGGTYYVPSHNARIKVVTRCSENLLVNGWDMSDTDFCPPIDYSLITDEEKLQVDQLLAEGILTEADIINREITALPEIVGGEEELPVIPEIEGVAMTTEEIATTTEEVATTTEEDGIIDQIIEAIDSIVDEIIEKILPDELISEETPIEDAQIIDETTIIEEISVEEVPVVEQTPVVEEVPIIEEVPAIEQAPAVEEQAVVAPENVVVENVAPSEPAPADAGVPGEI